MPSCSEPYGKGWSAFLKLISKDKHVRGPDAENAAIADTHSWLYSFQPPSYMHGKGIEPPK